MVTVAGNVRCPVARCPHCLRRLLLAMVSTLRPRFHSLIAPVYRHRRVWQSVVVLLLTPRCARRVPRRTLPSRTMHGSSTDEPHPGEHATRRVPRYLTPFALCCVADHAALRERAVLCTPPPLLERSCACAG
jgi:hypothetical protein